MTFEEKVKMYIDLREQADQLNAEIDTLKKDLEDEFSKNGYAAYEYDNYILKYIAKTSTVYNNEEAIMEYLEKEEPDLIQKSISKTKLNNKLRSMKDTKLVESLKPYYTTSTSYCLNLCKKKEDEE